MSDVNNVVLIGRLTRDAELKYTTSGIAVTKFSIAVNKKRKSGDTYKDEAHFFEIVLWGKSAESLHVYLKKGKQVAVTGELTQDRWEQNGQNHSKVAVTASAIQLLGGRSDNPDSDNAEPKQESFSPDNEETGFADVIPF